MDIKVETLAEGASLVRVSGELDIYTAPRLREQLLWLTDQDSSGCARVLLDLNDVTFIDSTGLGAIVGAHRRFTQRGGVLELVCGSGPVRRLLSITRLDQVFRVHERMPETNSA